MNLHGATDEIELPVINDEVYVRNSWTDSVPIVIHGNGPSKVIFDFFYFICVYMVFILQKSLNYLSNYVARTWSPTSGCLQCKENVIDLTKIDDVRMCCSLFCCL